MENTLDIALSELDNARELLAQLAKEKSEHWRECERIAEKISRFLQIANKEDGCQYCDEGKHGVLVHVTRKNENQAL